MLAFSGGKWDPSEDITGFVRMELEQATGRS